MSRIAQRIAAVAYVLGLATAAVVYVLFCAWLAPDPGPPIPDMAPMRYRINELAPNAPRETWQERHDRLKEEGKETPR